MLKHLTYIFFGWKIDFSLTHAHKRNETKRNENQENYYRIVLV